MNLGLYIISTSSRPYVRVIDAGTLEEMDIFKLHFFFKRVYLYSKKLMNRLVSIYLKLSGSE